MTKKRVIYIVIGVVLLAGSFAVNRVVTAINQPTKGVITSTSKVSETQNTDNVDMTPVVQSSKYASFNYPEALTKEAQQSFNLPFVAVYNYTKHDVSSWELAISIMNVSSGSLNDNGSYHYRKVNPDKYIESNKTINDKNVVIMTDQTASGFAKVAFLVNGQYQATISLTGDHLGSSSSLDETFNMVISSWRWLIQ